MYSQLTYQQKNLALLVLAIMGILLIYMVNIRKTWAVYQSFRSTTARINQAATAGSDMSKYQSQLIVLKSSSQQPYDRERLLEEVTGFCREKGLLIRSFPDAQRVVENGVSIITNELEVEGAYKDIVSLVYLVEQQKKLASVSTLSCFLHKDRTTRKTNLRGRVVLRNAE